MPFSFSQFARTHGPVAQDNTKLRRIRMRRQLANYQAAQTDTPELPDISTEYKVPTGVFAPPILRRDLNRERALQRNLEGAHRGLLTDESKRAGTFANTAEFKSGLETDLQERLPGAQYGTLKRQEGILRELAKTNKKRRGALGDVRSNLAGLDLNLASNGGAVRRGFTADQRARVNALQRRLRTPETQA